MTVETRKPYEPGHDWKTGYETRDGRPVRILADDLELNNGYTISAVVGLPGKQFMIEVASNGNSHNTAHDLFVKPVKKTIWLNVYPESRCFIFHHSRESADEAPAQDRIACLEVTYTEGEGL